MNTDDMPNIEKDCLHLIDRQKLLLSNENKQKPRILMLYGSLRPRSFSRFASEEAARILQAFGAQTKNF